MEPAWARAFEPPSVCSSESACAIRVLLDLYRETGDRKYPAPIPAAIDWFNRSEIAPNTWARLYELGTNRPLYGDRDGKIHYTLEEISEERRRGYTGGAYGIRENDRRLRTGEGRLCRARPPCSRSPPRAGSRSSPGHRRA